VLLHQWPDQVSKLIQSLIVRGCSELVLAVIKLNFLVMHFGVFLRVHYDSELLRSI